MGCGMGIFERYLTVWVGLGILAGVGLGLVSPQLFEAVAAMEWAHVNLVVAVFNLLVGWDGLREDQHGRTHLALAQFAL